MPGIDLNLDLPTLADTFSDIVSKLVVALDAIETDLAARVTAGELDITTELTMNGAPLTNVGGVRLMGGESTVVGTLYMNEELYAVTTAGSVQITSNGGLNVAALGTIGGDYGGANPAAVTYDDISGEYRFTEAPGDYAKLVASDLVLEGAAGSVRINVDPALSGAKTLSFKSFPAAGVSGMVYNAATETFEDGAVTRESNTHLFTAINLTGDCTAVDFKFTGPRTKYIPSSAASAGVQSGTLGYQQRDTGGWTNATADHASNPLFFPIVLDEDSVISDWTINVNKTTNATVTITVGLYSRAFGGSLTLVGSTVTLATNNPGNTVMSATGLTVNMDPGKTYVLRVSTSSINGDYIQDGSVTYTRPV